MEHLNTKRLMTLKIIDLEPFTEMQIKILRYNLQCLKLIEHPNIVKVDSWAIEFNTAFIISEYLTGGEYFDKVIRTKNITEKTIASIVHQLLSALSCALSKGVAHLDLKPENILLDKQLGETHIRIVDFGLNKFMGQEHYLLRKLGETKRGGSVSSLSFIL